MQIPNITNIVTSGANYFLESSWQGKTVQVLCTAASILTLIYFAYRKKTPTQGSGTPPITLSGRVGQQPTVNETPKGPDVSPKGGPNGVQTKSHSIKNTSQVTLSPPNAKLPLEEKNSSISNKNIHQVEEKNITATLLKEIPKLKNWQLTQIQTVALSLLFHAMQDKNHPSYIRESIESKSEDSFYIKRHIEDLETYIKDIKIESSAKEMIDTYNKYGVIQLRPLKEDVLVLGCGNTPADKIHYRSTTESHDHSNTDTINIHMKMNPSIIAFWGHETNNLFFKDKQIKYRLIVDEGPICSFLYHQNAIDQFFRAARESLKPNGYLALPSHVLNFSIPSDFTKSNDSVLSEAKIQNVHPVTLFKYSPEKKGLG